MGWMLLNFKMFPPEIEKLIREGRIDKNIVEAINYIIFNSSLTYSDIFGEEIILRKIKDDEWIIKRKGLPIPVLLGMFKYLEKIIKEIKNQKWKKP